MDTIETKAFHLILHGETREVVQWKQLIVRSVGSLQKLKLNYKSTRGIKRGAPCTNGAYPERSWW